MIDLSSCGDAGGRIGRRILREARDYRFFFQAEDGIRDHCVTGVQTCALPISTRPPPFVLSLPDSSNTMMSSPSFWNRSEERRVGKSVDLGGRRIIKKKKKNHDKYNESVVHKEIHRHIIRDGDAWTATDYIGIQ